MQYQRISDIPFQLICYSQGVNARHNTTTLSSRCSKWPNDRMVVVCGERNIVGSLNKEKDQRLQRKMTEGVQENTGMFSKS